MIRCTKIFWSAVTCQNCYVENTSRTHACDLTKDLCFRLADRLYMFTALNQFKCSCVYCRRLANYSLLRQLFSSTQYSSLSWLARKSMLMLTELPEMVTVFERFFQLDTVKVILVTCTVMPELRGITTVCHLKHSWL